MVDRSAATEVRRQNLSYLSPEKFKSLYDCIDGVYESGAPGDFLEFGVALGGSGICLAKALSDVRRYFGFDVFAMIPPPSEKDGAEVHARYAAIAAGKSTGLGGQKYYGYIDDLLSVVKRHFLRFGCPVDDARISLVRGLFNDTLPSYKGVAVALAHIDCDWYEPVMYCLDFVWPRLMPGGFIILDDYNDWDGCKKATDEFVARTRGAKLLRTQPHGVIARGT